MVSVRKLITIIALGFTLSLSGCSGPESNTGAHQNQTVNWKDIKGFKVPAGVSGPQNTADIPPSGFAHDDFGAALAAANLSIALDTADEKTFGKVLQQATIDDDGRKTWAAARAGLIYGQPNKDKIPSLHAWQVQAGEENDAATHVFLYWQQYDGSLTEQRRDMKWQEDDWKLKLPTNPQTPQLRAVDAIPDSAHIFHPEPS